LVETDKTVVEVQAPAEGVLGAQLATVDDVLSLGEQLCSVILDATDKAAAATVGAGAAAKAGADPPRRPSSPRARRRATELGIDAAQLSGTGPDGLITESDVERAAPAPADRWQGRVVGQRRRLEPARLVAARRTAQAWAAAPHIVQMVDADLTAADAQRRAWGVTWTELAVVAMARALVAHPHLNATVEGDDLITFVEVNIGVAVDTPSGLIVPVIAGADRRSLADVSSTLRELAERARANRLTAGDVSGGTATLSNLGSFGIRAGTPVLNPPESVLVFLGAVEDRVVAVSGEIVVRRMATLSVAFDHRATDGASAARFTTTLRDLLEDPGALD
jgi:pyruvate dehydrogenase E2 component (dihydrolipoamide acetyltransferase)